MKIGLSTQIYWDYEKLNLPKTIKHVVSDLGFEAVEIHCENPLFKGWGREEGEETKRKVKEVLSTLDVKTSLHGPFHDLNLATLNYRVRKMVLSQLREAIQFANYIDSQIVVVHPGFVSSRKYKRERCLEVIIQNLKKLANEAENFGVTLCLENLARKRKVTGSVLREVKKILEEVNHENLKMTLDTAHANTTDSGPVEFARELKDPIRHLHVSDNTGEDVHSLIGEGNIDFVKVFKELQPFEGITIIEGWMPKNEDPFVKLEKEKLEEIIENL